MHVLMIEIYKEAPGRRRECLYYLALGQYKLGHYNEARRYNDSLLEKEPRNMQALSLKALIEDRVAKGILPSQNFEALMNRGVCWNGYCGKCGYRVHCCCSNVGKSFLLTAISGCKKYSIVGSFKLFSFCVGYSGCIMGSRQIW